jgi:hypothetical protein
MNSTSADDSMTAGGCCCRIVALFANNYARLRGLTHRQRNFLVGHVLLLSLAVVLLIQLQVAATWRVVRFRNNE